MLEWADHIGLPVHVVLTKADKLKKGPAASTRLKVQNDLIKINPQFSVQTFSSLKKSGIEEAHAKLDEWFGLVPDAS
jgi:GTP-binding protein